MPVLLTDLSINVPLITMTAKSLLFMDKVDYFLSLACSLCLPKTVLSNMKISPVIKMLDVLTGVFIVIFTTQ